MSDLMEALSAEAKRIEEDTEHSFKGHYNAAARWARYHLYIGIPSALVAAVAGAAAFKDQPELAGSLALISTALTTLLTFLKPSERSEIHKSVAGQYHALRSQARMFREIELLENPEPKIAKTLLLEMARSRDELNQASPAISRCDYEQAKSDIDDGRARYQVDGTKT
ncbi:MAG: SLATT domain-containing protein [Pseudomonadota bacterium]